MQKFQKMIKYLGTAISVVMVGLAILLGFSVRWMFKTWPNLAVDELVFHLTEPLSGANQDMIIEYIVQCIVPMLLVLILFSVLLCLFCYNGNILFNGCDCGFFVYSMGKSRNRRILI